MRYFCTLFDSSFFSRGLVMINSLIRTHDQLKIVVFAFDNLTYDALTKLDISEVEVISLNDFESPELLAIKDSRSTGEYCWTSTPFTILYCLERLEFDHCTYVDADLYFVNNTSFYLEDMIKNNQHSLITPHFYTEKYDQSKTSGTFCVQYMLFRNTEPGLLILREWGRDCLDWCFARFEDGKFGDQFYLDKWPSLYGDVIRINQDRGLGVAPWNAQQYALINRKTWVLDTPNGEEFNLKFYHFHALRFVWKRFFIKGWYPLPSWSRRYLYPLYIKELHAAARTLREHSFNFNPHAKSDKDFTHIKLMGMFKRSLVQLLLRG